MRRTVSLQILLLVVATVALLYGDISQRGGYADDFVFLRFAQPESLAQAITAWESNSRWSQKLLVPTVMRLIADPETGRVAWWWVHLASVLALASVAVLLVLVLHQLGFPTAMAAIAALLFAVHPIKDQAVMWPAAVYGYTLPLAAMLIASYWFLRATDRQALSPFAISGILVLSVYSVLSIEQMAPLLILALVVGCWKRRDNRRAVLAGLGIAAASASGVIASLFSGGSADRIARFDSVPFIMLPDRILVIGKAALEALVFAPLRLVFDPYYHGAAIDAALSWRFLGVTGAVTAAIALISRSPHRDSYALAESKSTAWKLVAATAFIAVPVTPLILVNYYLPDRVFFFPALGFSVFISVLLVHWPLSARTPLRRIGGQVITGAGLLVCALGVLVHGNAFARYWEQQQVFVAAFEQSEILSSTPEHVYLINFPRTFEPVPSFINDFSFQGIVNWLAPTPVNTLQAHAVDDPLAGFSDVASGAGGQHSIVAKENSVNLFWIDGRLYHVDRLILDGGNAPRSTQARALHAEIYKLDAAISGNAGNMLATSALLRLPSLDAGILKMRIRVTAPVVRPVRLVIHVVGLNGVIVPHDRWIRPVAFAAATAVGEIPISAFFPRLSAIKEIRLSMSNLPAKATLPAVVVPITSLITAAAPRAAAP